jgi:hypothetical protein
MRLGQKVRRLIATWPAGFIISVFQYVRSRPGTSEKRSARWLAGWGRQLRDRVKQ